MGITKKRKLQIKSFHVEEVVVNTTTFLKQHTLSIGKTPDNWTNNLDYIKDMDIKIINPSERNLFINSIMDFIPISTKVLGTIGEGITHTLTGVCVMLTGADETGVQVAEFGSSEGILREQVSFDRAGTPNSSDIIIHIDITLKKGGTKIREGINQCHQACDEIVQDIREMMKSLNGRECTEKHEFCDEIKPDGKKVVILKQVAGQGTMYDTRVFSSEPSGFKGGRSVIDFSNVPIFLTPNEYRDGAIRAMH